jgi:hypothetical protein
LGEALLGRGRFGFLRRLGLGSLRLLRRLLLRRLLSGLLGGFWRISWRISSSLRFEAFFLAAFFFVVFSSSSSFELPTSTRAPDRFRDGASGDIQ